MRKFLSLTLAVMFVLSIATMGWADVVYTRGTDARVSIVVHANSATPALDSTITTNNRILGFTYTDSAAGQVGLYDGTVVQAKAGTGVFGEIKVAAGGLNVQMYPLPKNVTTSISYIMSTATGCVTIYYE
jgi:hypothetical protein